MSGKVNYFTHRVRTLEDDSSRSILGEREVKTLLTVLDIQDGPKSLNGKSIADLGCGDQHLRAAFEFRGASYQGIDIKDCNLETDSLPIPSEKVDIVVAMAVIEHLRDPGHFFDEIKRILRHGGALWMDTPDIEACGNKFWNDPTHVHPYTRASLGTLLEMSGFEDAMVTPNYRCKNKGMYSGTAFSFFCARHFDAISRNKFFASPKLYKRRVHGAFLLVTKGLKDQMPQKRHTKHRLKLSLAKGIATNGAD